MMNNGIMRFVRRSISGAWPSGKATDFESLLAPAKGRLLFFYSGQ
jgi:hypothetical protein